MAGNDFAIATSSEPLTSTKNTRPKLVLHQLHQHLSSDSKKSVSKNASQICPVELTDQFLAVFCYGAEASRMLKTFLATRLQ